MAVHAGGRGPGHLARVLEGGPVALFIGGLPGPVTTGTPYAFTAFVGGGQSPYTLSLLTGSLPGGLGLSGGSVTGTPSAAGTFDVTLRVTDAASPTPGHADLACSFVVSAPLTITNSPPATASVGGAYAYTPATSGGRAPLAWSIVNEPSWAAFNASTGALSGSPSAAEVDAGVAITATDADGRVASTGAFTIAVSETAGSDIQSLEIVGATLLDATGDYGDSTSRAGVDGNGWVAKVEVPFLSGETFDPTKITLSLSDPGYDATGTTTVTRTVRGGRVLRRQYTAGGAQADEMSANDGVTLTLYFSLIGDGAEFATVYGGTTITAVSAASGYYGASAAGSVDGGAVTNSSTRAYPKALGTWIGRHHQSIGPGGCYVEYLPIHRHAMNGRQVARVEFVGQDAQSTPNMAATQTTSTPTLSTVITQGQPPEVYAATIPVTALTQGDVCLVNAKVYPWIGDSSAVLDLMVDGAALNGSGSETGSLSTANPITPFRFLNNKTGAYGGKHASVKVGASGGTVQSSESASRATPYPDLASAVLALAAAQGGHHGGGHIWLMDDGAGGAVAHEPGDNINDTTGGLALCEVRQSPANTAKASIVLNVSFRRIASMFSFHVDIDQGASNFFHGGDGSPIVYYCDLTLKTVNAANQVTWAQTAGVINVTHVGDGTHTPGIPDMGTAGADIICLHGYVNTDRLGDKSHRARSVVGCVLYRTACQDPTAPYSGTSLDGKVWVNNLMLGNINNASRIGDVRTMTYGFAFSQNVVEVAQGGGNQALSIGDEHNASNMDNIVVQHTTIVGNRLNLLYCDDDDDPGMVKRATTRFNIFHYVNVKSDLFTVNSTETGRTGNWAFANGIERWDVTLRGDNSGGGDNGNQSPIDGGWLAEYIGNPSALSVGRQACHFTTDNANLGPNDSGSGGPGAGVYSLTGSTNAAYDIVPAGRACFSYDIAGVARKNDGSGAAGAYERTA